MRQSPKKILFIVTSTSKIGPHQRPTGYEFSEVARPYLTFTANGHRVDFASLLGGTPPEEGFDASDSASAIFRQSSGFRRLEESVRLADVDPQRYDAIFFPGGLGPMVDMVDDPVVKKAIADTYERGGVVGAVCHGPVALLDVGLSDGSSLLDGKKVASFTGAEEEGHSVDDVPFLLDEALVEQGAQHTFADPFDPHVVVDERLVTGQNPASAAGVAAAMIDIL